ncbi:hypothetical protein IV56_GL000497 [Lacticaseibacillus saniviri JCM 17471 = DSM 24301]|uniref:Uncharacterized protein n=1 Tax=Lacticaseibacillus saniviri JCM 17471 = DSM 24301 TaxID=1293598 RepID=A0A0R2N025_9LACO|nr:hypothetical protein IV56_GL000497 [Lacticaseibacillus saniviri JCM 17471 = DSM 24301]
MKNGYSYLHPDYWKRKLIHLLFVLPFVYWIDNMILLDMFGNGDNLNPNAGGMAKFLALMFTILTAYFYPFSLWWYKQSFIGRFLNNLMFIGGLLAIIGRILAVIFGGMLIAGVLAPIMGPLTFHKCRKKNMVIGDESDFV